MSILGRPVVFKYYLYQLTDSVGFIWPVFTLFLLWNDLTYTQIGTLGALSAVLVVVFELPTGYVADRVGRRNALAAGMGVMAASTAGFVAAGTFAHFVVLYVLWALALAFHHGTDDAWLYATLRATADEASFTRIRGRGGAVYQLGSAVTMVAGGFLYVAHPTLPFAASAALNAAGVAVVLSMPQNPQFTDGPTPDADPRAADGPTPDADARLECSPTTADTRGALRLLREQFTRPPLRAFVAYVALFFGLVATADTYIQPILVDALEDPSPPVSLPAVGVGIPEEATLGFVYAGFALVAAVGSYHAETVRDRLGLRTALLALPLGVALLFVFPLALPLFALPVFFAMKGVEAVSKPLVSQYLNDRTAERGRATVLSAAAMSYAVVRAPMKPLVGGLADATTPLVAVAALGAGFLLAAAVMLVVTSPVTTDSPGSPRKSRAGSDD